MVKKCLRTWILLLLLPTCLGFTPLLRITPEASSGSDIPLSALLEETEEKEKKSEVDDLILFVSTDSLPALDHSHDYTYIPFEDDPSWVNSHLLLHNRAPPLLS
jgi:hypothetical protein